MEKNSGLSSLKNEIDTRLKKRYRTASVKGERFYETKRGVRFHIINLEGFCEALVVEYADTWEDGDLFYPEDYGNIDELFSAIVSEIEA